MKQLRIALGAQLLFFAAWGAYLLSSRNTASPEFYLETVPVDPRDPISGTYVALDYAISRPQAGECAEILNSAVSFYVKLDNTGKTAQTAAGPVPVYEAVDCARDTRRQEGWARAGIQSVFGGYTAKYGIERFFLNENDPRKDARSGSVLAKVKIDGNQQLVLLDLVLRTPQ